jgi:hypothetical protein
MADTEVIVQDQATGLFGFRLEMGRDGNGIRMQARRTGFRTQKAALTEYRRLCRQRDAQHPKPRLSDTVQDICQKVFVMWVGRRVRAVLTVASMYRCGSCTAVSV